MNIWQYKFQQIKHSQVMEKINALGKEGWEAFNIIEKEKTTQIYFKRKLL